MLVVFSVQIFNLIFSHVPNFSKVAWISVELHCVKCVQIWSFSGAYFPAFGLNTERYEVSLCIQSECGKIWTRENSVFGHISHSVSSSLTSLSSIFNVSKTTAFFSSVAKIRLLRTAKASSPANSKFWYLCLALFTCHHFLYFLKALS